jgi:transcriptional regulator with XRE-family HTH domain
MAKKMDDQEHLARHLLGVLGSTIAQRRQRLRISQQELAERSNVDRAFISNVERGKRNPTFAALAKLSFGLGLRLSRLIAQAEQRLYSAQGRAANPRPASLTKAQSNLAEATAVSRTETTKRKRS